MSTIKTKDLAVPFYGANKGVKVSQGLLDQLKKKAF